MWLDNGRQDDNLRSSGQADSGFRARHCIQRPAWTMCTKGGVGEVNRWWRTCVELALHLLGVVDALLLQTPILRMALQTVKQAHDRCC